MDTRTCNVDLGRSRVEVLIFEFAYVTAIHGVSPVATELFHVEVMCTHTYLFIWIEGNTDVAMLYLWVLSQIDHSLNDLGYTCLVVCAE